MIRLLIVAIVSLLAFFPCFMVTSRIFSGDNDVAVLVALFLAWGLLPFWWLRRWQAKPRIEELVIDENDPLMIKQIARAQNELKRFIDGLNSHRFEASIRFKYAISGEEMTIWGVAHGIEDESVITSFEDLDDNGEDIIMRRRAIPLRRVVDWMLSDSQGNVQGGYSMQGVAEIYQRDHGALAAKDVKELAVFSDLDFQPLPESHKQQWWWLTAVVSVLVLVMLLLVRDPSVNNELSTLGDDFVHMSEEVVTFCASGSCDDFDYRFGYSQPARYEAWQDRILIDGRDAHDNQWSQSDIINLLQQQEFTQLDKYFAQLHGLYQQQRISEYHYRKILWRLGLDNESYIPLLTQWQAATESSYADLAIARTWQTIAWQVRGGDYAKNTSNEAIADFRTLMQRSKAPAVSALDKQSDLPLIYETLFSLPFGDKSERENIKTWLQQMEQNVPAAYYPRARLLFLNSPKWGGDYETIREQAIAAQSYVKQNPQLRSLLGFEWYYRAQSLSRRGFHRQALTTIDKALFHGEYTDWLKRRGFDQMKLGQNQAAVATFERVLAIDATDDYALRQVQRLTAGIN